MRCYLPSFMPYFFPYFDETGFVIAMYFHKNVIPQKLHSGKFKAGTHGLI